MKIIDYTAFEESQFMARMAVLRVQARVAPESYWAAAMACLMEAYGK